MNKLSLFVTLPLLFTSFAVLNAADRPNVVFILSDNHSYYEFGFHGNEQVRTPNIDNLAAQSFEFTNWHADAYCSPSRASLLTGINSMRHGIYHTIAGRYMLPDEAVTIAELLGGEGYATGIFGKWHLGDSYPFRPQDQGFATTFYNEGLSLANATTDPSKIRKDVTFSRDGKPSPTEGYCTDRVFDEAIGFIETHKGAPFFCYVPTIVTHKPWEAPDGYVDRYRGKAPDNLVELYGEIQKLDENVGRLLAAIDRFGLRENTIVVFMTDQGMHGNWHEGRGAPGQTTGPKKTGSVDGRHLVPFLIRQPGRIKPGKSDELVWNPDLMPTLLDLCDVATPGSPQFDGQSLRSILEGTGNKRLARTIILQCPRARTGRLFEHAAVKTQRWRLMDGVRLTDAQADPLQMKDVSADHPEVVERLRAAYETWWKTVDQGEAPVARPVIGADACPATRLHAMQWHFGFSPWHPKHLADHHSGGWKVHVAKAGRYRIELRRYPRPSDLAIGATEARLQIGRVDITAPLKVSQAAIQFDVELEAGDTELKTILTAPGRGRPFSAYFAYISRL
jgi:arylsulfatase A-like enzyme